MPRHAEEPRPGDGLVKAGVVVFLVGVGAIAAMFVPFVVTLVGEGARTAQDKHEFGLAMNLAAFLTSVGIALGLAGLVRQARDSGRRSRADG